MKTVKIAKKVEHTHLEQFQSNLNNIIDFAERLKRINLKNEEMEGWVCDKLSTVRDDLSEVERYYSGNEVNIDDDDLQVEAAYKPWEGRKIHELNVPFRDGHYSEGAYTVYVRDENNHIVRVEFFSTKDFLKGNNKCQECANKFFNKGRLPTPVAVNKEDEKNNLLSMYDCGKSHKRWEPEFWTCYMISEKKVPFTI